MATQQRQEALFEEGRIDLARHNLQIGRFQTPHASAIAFDVSRKKLKNRIAGIGPRVGSIAKNRLLTPTEEQTLVQWILLMDRRGMPPRLSTIH
jgi:hypothetical protein